MKVAKTVKTQEREKSIWQGKKFEGKEQKKKGLRKKLLMHHLKVILMLLLKNISSKILHTDVVVNE